MVGDLVELSCADLSEDEIAFIEKTIKPME
jgi:hypothetical protein